MDNLDMPIDVHVVKVFNRVFGRMFPRGKEGGGASYQTTSKIYLHSLS